MKKKKQFTHIGASGNPALVDVSEKKTSLRTARARATVRVGAQILALLKNNELTTKKGAVFQTAIIAGITGAKKTSDLIPLCHPLGLDDCQIKISVKNKKIVIDTSATLVAKTGVEMEALTAASIAALTIYDMCKALSHNIIIEEIQLMEKTGGKNNFKRK